jgi:hypothetical protein
LSYPLIVAESFAIRQSKAILARSCAGRLRVADRVVFRGEHRLNAGRFKSFPAPMVWFDLNYSHRQEALKRLTGE